MRLAMLWTNWTGYMNAACARFAQTSGSEVLVLKWPTRRDSPFATHSFPGLAGSESHNADDVEGVAAALERFQPTVILCSNWHAPAYRAALANWRGRAVRVCCTDTQWLGTARQVMGVVGARWYLRPLYDAIFVPGARQARFARMLGFKSDRIFEGLYCCEEDVFEQTYRHRLERDEPKAFMFIGRTTKSKGVDVLLEAFEQYQARTPDAWPLICCGTGDLDAELKGHAYIDHRGFIQPDALGPMLEQASCLVLPSHFEPWGVVVHEAVKAGLSVICTDRCGSSDAFVSNGANGSVIPSRDAAALTAALVRHSSLNAEELRQSAATSHDLAGRVTLDNWASSIMRMAEIGKA